MPGVIKAEVDSETVEGVLDVEGSPADEGSVAVPLSGAMVCASGSAGGT